MNNKYFLLRHGKNIHQTELKDFLYCWPDDTPPVSLIKEGIEDIEKAGELLKDKHIDCVFSSDILRTKQTSQIISEKIGFDLAKVIFDEKLRDINWGIWGGKKEAEAWEVLYNNNYLKRFENAPLEGETWSECQNRMVEVFKEIENNHQDKTILIISHGDPLWLLEGYNRKLDNQTLLNRKEEILIQPGEFKEIL
ncbi:MAG: histidine phosphatase family protein [Candidatus Paceibacterota bacterium]|jgi:broad specificity phosphatase PhoE